MTTVQEIGEETGTIYSLEGTLIEACSCGVNCPCWIGEGPDFHPQHTTTTKEVSK